MILRDNLCRRLLSNAWHSWYIVGRIAHKRLKVDKLCGSYLIAFLDILGIIVLHFRPALLRLGNADFHLLCRQLKQIPVSGDDRHFHSLLRASLGQGSDQVIRLQPRLLDNPDAHRL